MAENPRDGSRKKNLRTRDGRHGPLDGLAGCCVSPGRGGHGRRRPASSRPRERRCSIRWAVVLNDRGRLAAQLQGMPATAATLNGKPSLKR